jgi:hypothetical protein
MNINLRRPQQPLLDLVQLVKPVLSLITTKVLCGTVVTVLSSVLPPKILVAQKPITPESIQFADAFNVQRFQLKFEFPVFRRDEVPITAERIAPKLRVATVPQFVNTNHVTEIRKQGFKKWQPELT